MDNIAIVSFLVIIKNSSISILIFCSPFLCCNVPIPLKIVILVSLHWVDHLDSLGNTICLLASIPVIHTKNETIRWDTDHYHTVSSHQMISNQNEIYYQLEKKHNLL